MKPEDRTAILQSVLSNEQSGDFITGLIDASPYPVALLDGDRRLVYANPSMLGKAGEEDLAQVSKLRPGDFFGCVNSQVTEEGCGHSEACRFCGAFQAMQESRKEKRSITREYRVLSDTNHQWSASTFRFTSTPIESNGAFYYLVTLEDISNEIRRGELEKIFFHDLMNGIAGLHGVLQLMKERGDTNPFYTTILESAYRSMHDTILEQKQFSLAESGNLQVKRTVLNSRTVIREAALPFMETEQYRGSVQVVETGDSILFESDPVLLSRVLTNMLKNAMEASQRGDVVTIGADREEGFVRFRVKNPGFIPRDLQLQIFERAFSTKGKGRGIGTFSMKLLGENYLGGRVDFRSEQHEGTTFWIDLPAL